MEENKDQEQLRKLRREAESLKTKNSELLNEIEDLNMQVNDLRTERQTQIWTYNKEIEQEREK